MDKELEDLMNYNKFDNFDSIFLPYDENAIYLMDQDSHKPKDPEVKLEVENDGFEIRFPQQEKVRAATKVNEKRNISLERKKILHLINSFRTVTHATRIVFNYHNKTRKDSLNKVHTNILSILAKEGRKLNE